MEEEPVKLGRFRVRNLKKDDEDSTMEPETVSLQSELPSSPPKKPSRFRVKTIDPKSCDTALLHNGLSSIISQLQSLLQEIPRTGGKKSKRRKSFRNKRTQRRRK